MRLRIVSSVVAFAVAMATTACTSQESPSSDGTGKTPVPTKSLRDPDEQWAANMSRCMKDKGWDVTVDINGGIEAKYPSEQADRYQSDTRSCFDELGYRMEPSTTEAEAGRRYDVLIKVADCVKALGHPVSEPPSKQAYVEGVMNKRIPWHPYQSALGAGNNPTLTRELEEKCPVPRQ